MVKDAKAVKRINERVLRKDRESYLFLALFLLVLSFFIVLVAISRIDAARAVLVFRQISKTLEENTGLKSLRREIADFVGVRVTEIETLRAIDAEWSSQVPFINQRLDPERLVYEIDIPYNDIFDPRDNRTIRIDREELLLRTANLLNHYGDDELRVYVDVRYLGPALGPLVDGVYPEVLALGNFARRLEREAVDRFALSLIREVDDDVEPRIRFNIGFGPKIPSRLLLPLPNRPTSPKTGPGSKAGG